MRKLILISLAVLIVAAALALVFHAPPKLRAGPWALSDGSTLSLAGVTYGSTNTMRYGNKIAVLFYPVLTPWLRQKFGAKEAALGMPTNSIVVWFWNKFPRKPPLNRFATYRITVQDEYGMESLAQPWGSYPNMTVFWRNDILTGVALKDFPRRSREFTIRLYATDNHSTLIGEFKIPNHTATNYPVWTASALPVTVKTNGLEISLAEFENGKGGARAGIRVRDEVQAGGDWAIRSVQAVSATGETRDVFVIAPKDKVITDNGFLGNGRAFIAMFQGALWHEEPAWKLKVELQRGTNFLPQELWNIKAVPVQWSGSGGGQPEITTNIYGSELGFSLAPAKETMRIGQRIPDPVTLYVHSPFPPLDAHLVLVEVKDENGRNIAFDQTGTQFSTGGRGATIRQVDETYELSHAGDRKTLDITFAYSKSLFVEFLARPTVKAESLENAKP